MLANCASRVRHMEHQQIDVSADALGAFLNELGELSRRYGLAITEGATLFLMDDDDYVRSYVADDESCLSFA